jgi:hypothetical protein
MYNSNKYILRVAVYKCTFMQVLSLKQFRLDFTKYFQVHNCDLHDKSITPNWYIIDISESI